MHFSNSAITARESIQSVFTELENLYENKSFAKTYALQDTVSEIICCNDGSTDGTAEFLDDIRNQDYGSGKCPFIEIKVMHLKADGLASAMNEGLKVSRGFFIAFNDGECMWLKGSLVQRLKVLSEEPNADLITASHNRDNQQIPDLFKAKSHVNLFYITLHDELFRNYFTIQNAVLKRKIIDNGISFREGSEGSEAIFFFFQIVDHYKCLYLNEKMSRTILSKEGYSSSVSKKKKKALERSEIKSIKYACRQSGVPFAKYLFARIYSLGKLLKLFIVGSVI